MRNSINTTLGFALLLACGSTAFAGDDTAARIAQARSAAPEAISAEATIMETDGTVLVEGSNGWT